jgi:hypothetical protein
VENTSHLAWMSFTRLSNVVRPPTASISGVSIKFIVQNSKASYSGRGPETGPPTSGISYPKSQRKIQRQNEKVAQWVELQHGEHVHVRTVQT